MLMDQLSAQLFARACLSEDKNAGIACGYQVNLAYFLKKRWVSPDQLF
jgi:hypothetical protein